MMAYKIKFGIDNVVPSEVETNKNIALANEISIGNGNRMPGDLDFHNEVKGIDSLVTKPRKARGVDVMPDEIRAQQLRTEDGIGGHFMLSANSVYQDGEFKQEIRGENAVSKEEANMLNHNRPGAGSLAAGHNRMEMEVNKPDRVVDIVDETPNIVLIRNPKHPPVAPKPEEGNTV